MKYARILAAGMLVATGAILFFQANGSGLTNPSSLTGTRVAAPFKLQTHHGRVFTERDLIGKPHLVFFGFTHCPDICPTTLAEITALMEKLGTSADKLLPIMISVDPERDTPAILKAYLSSFDRRIIALSGSREETAKALNAFKASARKIPLGEGDYTMDHTAGVLLRKADGSVGGVLDLHESEEVRLDKLRRLVRS